MNQELPYHDQPDQRSPLPASFIQRPRLYMSESSGERHVTWLELFFDLVFVVAVAELAHLLYDDMTLTGILTFTALFVPVWWQWIDFSYYADQFDTDGPLTQMLTLLVMFGIIVLALTIHDVTHGGALAFAGAYIALRMIIIGLYLWAWRTVPESRELAGRYSLSFVIALVVWCISLFVPEPLRFVLWGLALLIEIGNGPLTYATIKQVPTQISHMDERFGLFVILVLGEAVIAVATGVADTEWRWPATLAAVGGFVIASSLWWLYFARADNSAINQALRSNRRGLLRSFLYGYSHFFVFAGITATGVGIQKAIQTAPEALSLVEHAVLSGGVAACLLGISLVQWSAPQSLAQPIFSARLLGALICGVLVLAGGDLAITTLVALVVLVLLSLIGFETMYSKRLAQTE